MTKKVNKVQLVISKECYIHLRDRRNKLAATSCLLSTNLGFARGISVCSIHDNFNREIGRHHAKRFAIRALKNRECVFTREEVLAQLLKIPSFEFKSYQLYYYGIRVEKGEVNPVLSELELKVYKDSKG